RQHSPSGRDGDFSQRLRKFVDKFLLTRGAPKFRKVPRDTDQSLLSIIERRRKRQGFQSVCALIRDETELSDDIFKRSVYRKGRRGHHDAFLCIKKVLLQKRADIDRQCGKLN